MGFSRHPTPDDWAAYAADEVPDRTRSRLRRHLEGCARCQAELVRIEGIQKVLKLPLPEPDELSWRRLEVRLERQLQTPGEVKQFSVDLPPGATRDIRRRSSMGTVDLVRGRRWLLGGAAAAAVVVGFVALSPRTPPATTTRKTAPVARAPMAGPGEALVHSGAAPLRVELGTGHMLVLASDTEVTMPEPDRKPVQLELDHGRVDVWSPRAFAAEAALGKDERGPIIVKTPERALWAQSRDFTVAYVAGRHEVSVREGWVEVRGGRAERRVEAGQAVVLEESPPQPAEPGSPVLDRLRKKPRRRVAPAPPARSTSAADARVNPSRPEVQETRAPVPEVKVERIDEPAPAERAWARARDAWYRERDPAAAIAAARAFLAFRPAAELSRDAHRLICDAQVGLRAGSEALRDCKALLDLEREPGRIRR
ncbi:MAG: zf-HC2 domain-containing protein, partial [Myxococcota bacterium]